MIDVCAAIIEKEGRVMVARRKQGAHLEGFWEFPGGKVEKGETPSTCLARELEEEFGITAEIGPYVGESIYAYFEKEIRLLAFLVPRFKGIPRLVDHDKVAWLLPMELESLKWAPADIPLVHQYLALHSTSEYYLKEAKAYCMESGGFDASALYAPFLSKLQVNAHILDVGCGSGRDSCFFQQKGYRISALDSSPEIAAFAEKKINAPVEVKSFSEISAIGTYDGIWANASLLHCPAGQIEEVFKKLVAALKENGVWYMSFKHGTAESFDELGRFFNNQTKASLSKLLESFEELQIENVWENSGVLRNKKQRWVNALVRKCRSSA